MRKEAGKGKGEPTSRGRGGEESGEGGVANLRPDSYCFIFKCWQLCTMYDLE